MFRQRSLQIVGTFVACLQQQGGRLTVDKGEDTIVHVILIAGDRPVETLLERVESPQTGIVTLGGNHLTTTEIRCDVTRQLVGTTDMSAQHRHNVHSQTIDTHHSRVFVLILHTRGYCADTNAHRTNEYEGIEILPTLTHEGAVDNFALRIWGMKQVQQRPGKIPTLVADRYDRYFLHRNIVIG